MDDLGFDLANQATQDMNRAIFNILSDPNVPDWVADEIQDALDDVVGNNNGLANNGGADKLISGNLNAALVKIGQAIDELQGVMGLYDTTALQELLCEAARVAVLVTILDAENAGLPVSSAWLLYDLGEIDQTAQSFDTAVDQYQSALQAL
jgi:hypothetical protein